MSNINPVELQSARFAAIYPLARMLLLTRSYVELGNLFEALTEGDEGYPAAEDAINSIALKHEATALSELILNQLEQDFGPLIYRAPYPGLDTTDVAWGYAGRIIEATPAAWARGEELTPFQISQMWVSRLLALQDGHPDQADYANGADVPNASWRLAPKNKIWI